jgi:superfamily II DNA helicase RecQ
MKIRIFTCPVFDGEEDVKELNSFLSSVKVLDIQSNFFNAGNAAYWSFCVRFIDQQNSMAKEKTDYKKLLSKEQFDIFSSLRIFRKQISEKEAIPAYAVFTDEELAQIVSLEKIEESSIVTVKGIGQKRFEKYGNQLIEYLKNNAKV